MKHFKLFLLSVVAISSIGTSFAQAQGPSRLQRVKNFLSRHKGKIAAGVAAAAAIGIATSVAYHGNKTMNAIEKAGLDPNDAEFSTAVKVVGLFGPLGQDRTLRLISKAMEKNIITYEQAAAFLLSNTGDALAHYFDVNPKMFKARATQAGIKGKGRAKLAEVKNGWNNFKTWFSS